MASALLTSSSCSYNSPEIKFKNTLWNHPTNLAPCIYPLKKNLSANFCSWFSRLTVSNSQIQNGRPNFWRTTSATSSKIYKRLDSCLVIPPIKRRKPKAIVKFIGGAFIGAVPEVTYRSAIVNMVIPFLGLIQFLQWKVKLIIILYFQFVLAVIYSSNWQVKGIW